MKPFVMLILISVNGSRMTIPHNNKYNVEDGYGIGE